MLDPLIVWSPRKYFKKKQPESYVYSRTDKGKTTHQILFVWSLRNYRKSTEKEKKTLAKDTPQIPLLPLFSQKPNRTAQKTQ